MQPASFLVPLSAHTIGGIIGQKCSALSRIYVPSSLWTTGFKDQLLTEVAKLKAGPPQDFANFIGPVMCVQVLVSILTSTDI